MRAIGRRANRSRRFSWPIVLACALGATACASTRYVYQPTEQVSATVQGLPAARYAIPPELPEGTLRIASFGVRELQTADPAGGTRRLRMLLVRMIVENNGSDQPFSIDTRSQLLELAGEGSSRAAYVNGAIAGAPLLSIGKGQKAALDLYYPLPEPLQSESHLADFDLLWQVGAGTRMVNGRTSFERLRVEPPEDWYYSAGWGPYWWYDPFWGDFAFYHHPYWHYVGPPYPVYHYPVYHSPAYGYPVYRHPVYPPAPRVAPPPPPPRAAPPPAPPAPHAAPPPAPPPRH